MTCSIRKKTDGSFTETDISNVKSSEVTITDGVEGSMKTLSDQKHMNSLNSDMTLNEKVKSNMKFVVENLNNL